MLRFQGIIQIRGDFGMIHPLRVGESGRTVLYHVANDQAARFEIAERLEALRELLGGEPRYVGAPMRLAVGNTAARCRVRLARHFDLVIMWCSSVGACGPIAQK